MATIRDHVGCDRCQGDAASLRLIVTETVWYLLDVADDAIYPDQPQAERDALMEIACLDCGHRGSVGPQIRGMLRFE